MSLDALIQNEKALFRATVLENPFIPLVRNPDLPPGPSPKQAEFLCYMGLEALYGGSAGGGKTDSLLMAALQFVSEPRYAALLLRKSFRDLSQPDGLIPRSKEWLKGKADWSEQQKRWTFPSGATLTFGYLEHADDIYQYQGAAYQFIGWDEATQQDESSYRYLFSRARKLQGSSIPLRIRAASNPGGRGHEWVYQRFIVPWEQAKIEERPQDPNCRFFPARLHDNPYIEQETYVKSLQNLDPITLAQLLAGDWNAYQGGRFRKEWFRRWEPRQTPDGLKFILRSYNWQDERRIERLDEVKSQYVDYERGVLASDIWTFIACDTAASEKTTADYTAIGVFGVTPDMDLLVLHVTRARIDIERIVPTIADICAAYRPEWVAIEEAGASIAIVREAQRHPGIPSVLPLFPEGREKLVRATPAMVMAQAGQIFLPPSSKVHPWVEPFVSELVRFTGDPEKDGQDDQVDMLAYGVLALNRTGLGRPIVVKPDEILEAHYESGSSKLLGWTR